MLTKIYENPAVYRVDVPLPDNPLKNLNCYVVQDSGETLIIDTGFNGKNVWMPFWKGWQNWMRTGKRQTCF